MSRKVNYERKLRRQAEKKARRVRKKRRSAMRATRVMRRLGQVSEEDFEEIMEFWRTAPDEDVLRAVNRGVADAGLEPEGGLGQVRKLRKKAAKGGLMYVRLPAPGTYLVHASFGGKVTACGKKTRWGGVVTLGPSTCEDCRIAPGVAEGDKAARARERLRTRAS